MKKSRKIISFILINLFVLLSFIFIPITIHFQKAEMIYTDVIPLGLYLGLFLLAGLGYFGVFLIIIIVIIEIITLKRILKG